MHFFQNLGHTVVAPVHNTVHLWVVIGERLLPRVVIIEPDIVGCVVRTHKAVIFFAAPAEMDHHCAVRISESISHICEVISELECISQDPHPRLSHVCTFGSVSIPRSLTHRHAFLIDAGDGADKTEETDIRESVAIFFTRLVNNNGRVFTNWYFSVPI